MDIGVAVGPPGVGGKGGLLGPFALGTFCAPVGPGVCGFCGGTGVDGVLTALSDFGLSFVTRKLNLAPDPLGSHSMKLYEGK